MIAAHLIVGSAEEPFLPALLSSLRDVVQCVVANNNSEQPDGANARALAESSFAKSGMLFVDKAPFTDFARARNRTLDLHRRLGLGEWAAFVDADEVHRPAAVSIARNLIHVPADVATVDGYTRHYFQSFRLYTSIERRLTFFRVTDAIGWTGAVHERLAGINGRRLAIPYVYDHYGAVTPMKTQAAKGRRYSSLGQAGPVIAEGNEANVRAIDFFQSRWPLALRYYGNHAAAVSSLRRDLEASDGERFTWSELTAATFQPPLVRASNIARRLNFEYRWRARALNPLAAWLLRSS